MSGLPPSVHDGVRVIDPPIVSLDDSRGVICLARAEWERVRSERDTYALALAGTYTSAKVNEVLGQQTLCSNEEYRELRKAKARLEALTNDPATEGSIPWWFSRCNELQVALTEKTARGVAFASRVGDDDQRNAELRRTWEEKLTKERDKARAALQRAIGILRDQGHHAATLDELSKPLS